MPISSALSSSDSKRSASGSPVSQMVALVMASLCRRPVTASPPVVDWFTAGLLVHHIFGTWLERQHLSRAHQPTAVAPILGEEQLETGVDELGRALVDHSVGALLGCRVSESVDGFDHHNAVVPLESGFLTHHTARHLVIDHYLLGKAVLLNQTGEITRNFV